MYLIVGRTASGKDHLAHLLAEQDLNSVLSRTTRPKRGENDTSHIFVTPEEASNETNRVAFTKINGFEYYALDEDVMAKECYVIDPNGINPLAKAMPDMEFHIIYVSASEDLRKQKYISRSHLSETEAAIEFDERNAAEDEQFTKFEDMLRDNEHTDTMTLPENIREIRILPNDFEEKTMKDAADKFAADWRTHKALTCIVLESVELGIFQANESNEIQVINKNTVEPTFVKPEFVATMLMKDSRAFSMVMQEYLASTDLFKD